MVQAPTQASVHRPYLISMTATLASAPERGMVHAPSLRLLYAHPHCACSTHRPPRCRATQRRGSGSSSRSACSAGTPKLRAWRSCSVSWCQQSSRRTGSPWVGPPPLRVCGVGTCAHGWTPMRVKWGWGTLLLCGLVCGGDGPLCFCAGLFTVEVGRSPHTRKLVHVLGGRRGIVLALVHDCERRWA